MRQAWCFLLAAMIPAWALADDGAQDLADARVEARIDTTYALNRFLRADLLEVAVHDGKATLNGTVDNGVNRELAEQIALGADGIKAVDNQIVVHADYVTPQRAERSYGEVIDDTTTTVLVKSKLTWSRYVEGLSTEVITERGKVTLRGSADSPEARELAGRMALNTYGVVGVDNHLEVTPRPHAKRTATDDAMGEMGRDIADSWITAKVKSTLFYSSNVPGSDIKVSTVEGVVTLSGRLASTAQRELAIELANDVRGVRQVEASGLVI
ncbi:MAG: BON domain-containing protein [Gammaproteobacteria bacterium]|nr:BON domain-containing protein [Gammaproteobacteria bacterium]